MTQDEINGNKNETFCLISSRLEALEINVLKGSQSCILALSLQLGMRPKIVARHVPPQSLFKSESVQ